MRDLHVSVHINRDLQELVMRLSCRSSKVTMCFLPDGGSLFGFLQSNTLGYVSECKCALTDGRC
jgi:hypothetical protein